jgi:hypothetical protein
LLFDASPALQTSRRKATLALELFLFAAVSSVQISIASFAARN